MIDKKYNTSIKYNRILIVDDELFNLQALEIILGYSVGINCEKIVDRARNGQHALDIVKNDIRTNHSGKGCSYKLILMDCNMPLMDGYQATISIREHLYKLKIDQPIITAVTGHSS